jgi:hypothetical protein
MIYPLNNIKQLQITQNNVTVTYDDGTKMTINIPNFHSTKKDNLGNVEINHHNQLIFQKDYKNPNNQPEIDHCI